MAGSAAMASAADQSTSNGVTRQLAIRRASRVGAVLLLIAALAPGLWWRSPPVWPPDNGLRTLSVARVAARAPSFWPEGLRLMGAWRLSGTNNRFGGFSALLATDGGTLTAISDIGKRLRIRRPDLAGPPDAGFASVPRPDGSWFDRDIESATSDPRTGRIWLAYETSNAIQRFDAAHPAGAVAHPPAMRAWPANRGPEAMTRLADGRFIVLREEAGWLSAGGRPGLLFPSDPVEGAKPLQFVFQPPIGYDPSDMAALPDGRVLILLRALDPPFPPFFTGMLLVADPADIAAGKTWRWRKLADLADPLPRDNYEGLAVVPDARPGGVTLWLISDDNLARYQRTFLLELHWSMPPRGAEAAR